MKYIKAIFRYLCVSKDKKEILIKIPSVEAKKFGSDIIYAPININKQEIDFIKEYANIINTSDNVSVLDMYYTTKRTISCFDKQGELVFAKDLEIEFEILKTIIKHNQNDPYFLYSYKLSKADLALLGCANLHAMKKDFYLEAYAEHARIYPKNLDFYKNGDLYVNVFDSNTEHFYEAFVKLNQFQSKKAVGVISKNPIPYSLSIDEILYIGLGDFLKINGGNVDIQIMQG